MPKEKTSKILVLGPKGEWCIEAASQYFNFFGTWPMAREMQASYGYSISYWTNMFDMFATRKYLEEVEVVAGAGTRYFPTANMRAWLEPNSTRTTFASDAVDAAREHASWVLRHKLAMPVHVPAPPKEKKARKAKASVKPPAQLNKKRVRKAKKEVQ